MKIHCKDKKEYDDFIKLCSYLHDYCLWVGKQDDGNVEVCVGDGCHLVHDNAAYHLDFENHPLLNFVAHLPITDEELRKEFVTYEGQE